MTYTVKKLKQKFLISFTGYIALGSILSFISVGYSFSAPDINGSGTLNDCIIPSDWTLPDYVAQGGTSLADLESITGYSTQNSDQLDCSVFKGNVKCNNGVLEGSQFKYSNCTPGSSSNNNPADGQPTPLYYDGDVCIDFDGCSCANSNPPTKINNGDICYIEGQKKFLYIAEMKLANGSDSVAVNSPITLKLLLRNNASSDIISDKTPEGFITCTIGRDGSPNKQLFPSNGSDSPLRINAHTYQEVTSFTLPDSRTLTTEEGSFNMTCYIDANGDGTQDNPDNGASTIVNIAKISRFDGAMSQAIKPIEKNLDAGYLQKGTEGIKNYVFDKVMSLLVPMIVIVGILIAILGFYQILFVGGEDGMKKGIQYVIGGVVAIIIMMSAKYLSTVLYEEIFQSGNATALSGVTISQQIYDKIAFPFLKMAVYLVLGVMFVVLLGRVISYITSQSEDIKKKSASIIIWTVVSMLIILGAKQIVQATYGLVASAQVETSNNITSQLDNAQNLGELGGGIFTNKNIPILYEIINWVLGITSLVILVLIIFQTYQLLTNPEDPEAFKKIKKSFLYIFIGIMIIGVGYLITNFVIIN